MRLSGLLALVAAAAWPAAAGPVLVGASPSLTLTPGDELRFEFQSWNFGRYSANPYPSAVLFQLVTSPLDDNAPVFAASLESASGSLSLPFASPLGFGDGRLQSFRYSGPASVLSGSVEVASAARELFGNGGRAPTVLVLRDLNGTVTLGLPGYTLAREMNLTLAGGGVTVGAVAGPVFLESAPPRFDAPPLDSQAQPATVPEPATALPVALACLARLGWTLGRRRRHA